MLNLSNKDKADILIQFGIHMDSNLTWKHHIGHIRDKISKTYYFPSGHGDIKHGRKKASRNIQIYSCHITAAAVSLYVLLLDKNM